MPSKSPCLPQVNPSKRTGKKPVSLPPEEPASLKADLEALRLDPFVEFLATLFDNRPSPAAIAQCAKWRPDVWATMVRTFAGLAGYNDKTVELKHTGVLGHIHAMSDAQLREAAASLLAGKTIDSTAAPLEET